MNDGTYNGNNVNDVEEFYYNDYDYYPFITCAKDLYPVGHWVNQTGVIVVRYLPAISPNEATSRDDMMRLVSDDYDDDTECCMIMTTMIVCYYWRCWDDYKCSVDDGEKGAVIDGEMKLVLT